MIVRHIKSPFYLNKDIKIMPKPSFRSIRESYAGSVLIDNLTLSCATRLVVQTEKGSIPSYPKQGREKASHSKWNYKLNNGFRLGVDFACLAQVVQAIILYEKIIVDTSHLDRWGTIRTENSDTIIGEPPEIAGLIDCLIPLKLSFEERIYYFSLAVSKSLDYSKTDAFKDFMLLLSTSAVEDIFIHISHGYFETGYSDSLLFPRKEDHEDITTHIRNALKKPDELERYYRNSMFIEKIEFVWNFLSNLNQYNDDHVLEKTFYDPGDGHDKGFAGNDVLRNAMAAYYFQYLSELGGFPYLPHPLRSHFIAFDIIASKIGLPSTEEHIMKLLESHRSTKANLVNSFYGQEVVHTKIPFFLSMVLHQADNPRDIFDIAIRIRKTKEARLLREWLRELDRGIANGTKSIDKLAREVEEIQLVLSNWSNSQINADVVPSIDLGFNIGVLSITKKVSKPQILDKLNRPKKLRFLQSLAQISDLTLRFDILVENVFGKSTAELWKQYRSMIEIFQNVETSKEGKRYSPLDLEHRRSIRGFNT
jgi:hypothetical protein